MGVELHDGDAMFTKSFTKTGVGESTGSVFTFGFKPNKGKKFVVMLLGEVDGKSNDCDCEAMLNALGFFRKVEP